MSYPIGNIEYVLLVCLHILQYMQFVLLVQWYLHYICFLSRDHSNIIGFTKNTFIEGDCGRTDFHVLECKNMRNKPLQTIETFLNGVEVR